MNSDKYLFSDFTIDNYVRLLKQAKSRYKFASFNDQITPGKIFLRHDLDISIQAAEKMALVEQELQISSTFFVLIHCEFYNALDKSNVLSLKNIMAMGHKIGLHFDVHFYDIKKDTELENHILKEAEILESVLGINVDTFSFHNNNDFTLSCKQEKIGGLINVYSSDFKENIGYCSDSSGYWRYERLENVILESRYEILQVLIHPCWWQNEILPPRQRIFNLIDQRSMYLKSSWDKTLALFGEKNIDWHEVL